MDTGNPAGRVLICTSYPTAWGELAAVTGHTHRTWAQRHGYDYRADCSERTWPIVTALRGSTPTGRMPIGSFIKLDLLLYYLDAALCGETYDWVMWLDSDQLITNYDVPITQWTEGLVPYTVARDGTTTGKDVIMPYDFNGNNSTTIIARNTDLAYNYLYASNDAGRTIFLTHDWAEMEAMLRFRLAPPYTGIVQTYSAKELCALHPGEYRPLPDRRTAAYEWAPGDFSVHLAALPMPRRLELARQYVKTLSL